MFYLKDEDLYSSILVHFSSTEPSFNNDWADWKEEDQRALAYEDIILLSFGIGVYADELFPFHFVSENIPLPSSISTAEIEDLFPAKELLFEGKIKLFDGALDFGEEFGFLIDTLSNDLHIKLWQKSNQTLPEFLIELTSL